MTAPVKTSAEWQTLLDDRFPEGAVVSPVLPDGTLSSEGMYLCPVLVVMTMDGEWPLIMGIGGDGHDLQIRASSWEEIDRDGHFIARVISKADANNSAQHYEISSWLSPAAVESLATVRDSQREWLLQVAESAVEDEDQPEPDPAVDPGVSNPAAEAR